MAVIKMLVLLQNNKDQLIDVLWYDTLQFHVCDHDAVWYDPLVSCDVCDHDAVVDTLVSCDVCDHDAGVASEQQRPVLINVVCNVCEQDASRRVASELQR